MTHIQTAIAILSPYNSVRINKITNIEMANDPNQERNIIKNEILVSRKQRFLRQTVNNVQFAQSNISGIPKN